MNSLKIFKSKCKTQYSIVSSNNDTILEYTEIIKKLNSELENITNTDNSPLDILYIKISEKSKEIMSFLHKISDLDKKNNLIYNTLSEEKTFIINKCIEGHSNINSNIIVDEIEKILNNEDI